MFFFRRRSLRRLQSSVALTMKVRASIKRLCEACRIVKRRGKLFVVCKENRKVRP